MSKINKLTISNYLGIESISIEPGKINIVSGGNGKGKTAILKAIREAFISSGHSPDKIKLDAKKAELLVNLDDGVDIHRKITPTGNTVEVVAEGQQLSKPVSFLRGLLGPAFLFNPVEFYNAKLKERRELILQAVRFRLDPQRLIEIMESRGLKLNGIRELVERADYSKHGLEVLEEIKKLIYERRAEVNREREKTKKTIAKQRETIPESFNPDYYKDFELSAIMEQLKEANEAIVAHKVKENKLNTLAEEYNRLKMEVSEIEAEIERLKDLKEKKLLRIGEIREDGETLKAEVENFDTPDIRVLQNKVNNYEENQEIIQRLKEIKRYENELAGIEEHWKGLDKTYWTLANDISKEVIRQINLPIDGLGFDGEGITVNDVAIDNLSGQEQLEFAVKIARQLVGKLKVICVDGIESLDPEAKEIFLKIIESDDIQYFITEVTKGELKVEKVNSNKRKVAKSKSKKDFIK